MKGNLSGGDEQVETLTGPGSAEVLAFANVSWGTVDLRSVFCCMLDAGYH